MPVIWAVLALFWILIILVPELLSLLVWLVLLFIGWSIFVTSMAFKSWKKESIKFWSYEIFKNKKSK
ncbi:MAG: hypothetical protein ACD_2C00039G0002 [uncultured bacterium (gcode 4)]|uniref:Uncharacterized protein n=1 Tax=uncultured bacterium (gcode 4) TaxID=1234023 RepID=K2G4F1_9BACT|nr:MAG: hypothetical protein ACD_2C00039G0002 [uncultured bacterium (gcode 4)]